MTTVPCYCDRETPRVPLAPPEPDAESSRIARRQAAIAQQALPPGFVNTCEVCHPEQAQPRRRYTTLGERDRLLREVSACPFYRRNPHSGGVCQGTRVEVYDTTRRTSEAAGAPLLEVTRPYTIHQYRTHPRIRGIEDIAIPVRNPAAGELTARRRAAIVTAATSAIRHSEHFRTQLPPPPCNPPNTQPQPGVPYRTFTPVCNPGLQRVDYSNPLAK